MSALFPVFQLSGRVLIGGGLFPFGGGKIGELAFLGGIGGCRWLAGVCPGRIGAENNYFSA